MPRHPRVTKRKNSTNWQYRRKIPVDLQDHYGSKKEFKFSLKTSDYRKACEKADFESVRLDEEFATIRRNLSASTITELSEVEVDRIAQSYTHFLLDDDEGYRKSRSREETEDREQLLLKAQEDNEDTAFVLDSHRLDMSLYDTEWVESEMKWFLPDHGIKLEAGSEAYDKVAEALLKATVRAYELIEQRNQGKAIDTPSAPPAFTQQAPDSTGNGISMNAMLVKWNKERQGPQSSYIEFKIQVRRFIELHGDLDVDRIEVRHIREFKDAMLKHPRYTNSKTLRNKTVPQLLEYTEKHPST